MKKSAVTDMVADGRRLSETLDNLRALFGTADGSTELAAGGAVIISIEDTGPGQGRAMLLCLGKRFNKGSAACYFAVNA
jgi:hypothetical protein